MGIWKTEIFLNHRGRGIPFDSDLMHRILTRAFDSDHFLWSMPRAGVVLVQSDAPLPPETFHGEASSIRAKCVPTTFTHGQRVEIAGIVNPTKAQRRDGRHSAKVKLPDDQVPAWIARRMSGAVSLSQIDVESMSPAQGRRKDKSTILHTRRAFHAFATVTDPDRLASLIESGIGQGKRFGCGMLIVKPCGGDQQ